ENFRRSLRFPVIGVAQGDDKELQALRITIARQCFQRRMFQRRILYWIPDAGPRQSIKQWPQRTRIAGLPQRLHGRDLPLGPSRSKLSKLMANTPPHRGPLSQNQEEHYAWPTKPGCDCDHAGLVADTRLSRLLRHCQIANCSKLWKSMASALR